MGSWTRKRSSRCVRDRKGRFKLWTGGRRKSQLKKKQNTYQGIATHIGKEYKRQHGRPAKIWSCVRTKKADGTYHKGAFWYVRTKYGWRSTGSTKRPSFRRVCQICQRARTGRK